MATPVFCCGFECGIAAATAHVTSLGASGSFSTSTVRSGARSLRLNPSAASTGSAILTTGAATAIRVIRCYIIFASLPTSDTCLVGSGGSTPGAYFKQSDSKIYPGWTNVSTPTFGANGIAVTTGVWYRLDIRINITTNPVLVDVSVDGTAIAQASFATAGSTSGTVFFGSSSTETFDIFFDDVLVSVTSGDYPLGNGYVHHFVPTADGTHNVAGTNDFEIGTGGVDISNATTTAWQLVDDIPMQSGAIGTTDFINMILPPNATDYVECIFGPPSGIPIPGKGPRAVECIVGVASAGGAANNMEVRLNDNGTMGTVYTQTGVTLTTTITYGRAHFADPPSAATVWNANNDGGNGDFRDLRVRFGSPAVLDVTPDPYFASIMIEAEFEEQKQKITQIKQAVNRASTY